MSINDLLPAFSISSCLFVVYSIFWRPVENTWSSALSQLFRRVPMTVIEIPLGQVDQRGVGFRDFVKICTRIFILVHVGVIDLDHSTQQTFRVALSAKGYLVLRAILVQNNNIF